MMSWQYPLYVAPVVLAGLIAAALAFSAWQRRLSPGAAAFAVLMLAVAEWSLTYAVSLVSVDLPAALFWDRAAYLGSVMVGPAWLAFVLQYTGEGKWLTRRNLAMLMIIPCATLALVWTNAAHGLIYTRVGLEAIGAFLALNVVYGPWYWVHLAYIYVLLLSGTVVLFRMLLGASAPRLYQEQVVAILLGALAPWVASIVEVSALNPFRPLDLAPFAFTVTGLVVTWGLYGFRLLDIIPVARSAIVESMSDGVMVLDAQNRIVDLNPAAQRIMGRTNAEAVGQPAAQALSAWPDLFEHIRDATEAQVRTGLTGGSGQYTYDLLISPLRGRRGDLAGRLLVLRDITERVRMEAIRQRAEEALRLSEEKYRTLVENVNDVIFSLDTIGRITYISPAIERSAHYRPGEVIGQPFAQYVHPEDLPGLQASFAQTLSGALEPFEFRVLAKEGAPRHVLTSSRQLWDAGQMVGLIGVMVDITERKRAEEQIQRLHQDLERHAKGLAALNRAGWVMAATLDLDRLLWLIMEQVRELLDAEAASVLLCVPTLEQASESAADLVFAAATGPAAEKLVGTRLPVMAGLAGWAMQAKQSARTADAQSDPRFDQRIDAVTGMTTRSLLAVPLISKGQVLGVVEALNKHAGAFDAHDLEMLEALSGSGAIAIENARLYATEQQRAAALARALQQQRELDRLQREFIQNVSHELRTPLSLIRGHAEMLEGGWLGELQPKQQESIGVVSRHAQMLTRLVNDIVGILESEQRKGSHELMELEALAHICLAEFRLAAQEAGLNLSADIAPNLPRVPGDPLALIRMMDNLVANALKFTPAGGRVTVRLQPGEGGVLLQVADTGIGIPSDQLERIFDRFYQVDGSAQRRYGGVGLGLALVKEVAEAHGGRVAVTSQVGGGTTFTVWLPAHGR